MDKRDEQGKIWMDGDLVDWPDAQVHVMSHVLHYGTSVFEGMRCYKTPQGPSIFRLRDHIKRLFDSAKIYRIPIPYSLKDIMDACKNVIRVNEFESAYVRPIVFRGYHSLGVDPGNCPVNIAIAALNWGKYLGDEGFIKGVDVRVSSWNRMAPDTMPTLAKVGANYMSSQLIKMEAMADGYTEGIGLDVFGYVGEGSGENVFIVRDDVIYTPLVESSILPGLTRDCVFTIARDLGYKIVEQKIQREMLYVADEIFFSGTAAEITPVKSVDRITIGKGERGPVTENIQKTYVDYINGNVKDKYGWHDYVK
ncbi:MAG: branched-chain amino acid transaminase [candidate division KSB1 bacterium]|nr:branched-chain amino acid transaminase [candidate division KSB1 bacterium]